MTCVAAVQMASGPHVSANLLEAERLITVAADSGAELVVLPENFAHMGVKETDKLKICEADGNGPIQAFLQEQALKRKIWIVGGTIPLMSPEKGKVFASSLLFNNLGERVARYNKIHLFDVHLSENGENYNESETISPGDEVVVVDTPFGKLGIAVCYDLRFPGLFRQMIDQGVEVVAMPSAFTAITGKAHWEVLNRARAVENLIYIISAAQGGFHVSGRETHGDSMIVEPWGSVVNRLAKGAGVVSSEIDLDRLREIRIQFPVLEHRKLSCQLAVPQR